MSDECCPQPPWTITLGTKPNFVCPPVPLLMFAGDPYIRLNIYCPECGSRFSGKAKNL